VGPTVTLDTNGSDSSAVYSCTCAAYWELLVSVTGLSDTFQTNGDKLQEHLERVYCFKTKTLVLQPEV